LVFCSWFATNYQLCWARAPHGMAQGGFKAFAMAQSAAQWHVDLMALMQCDEKSYQHQMASIASIEQAFS
jgi:hypothetical protein